MTCYAHRNQMDNLKFSFSPSSSSDDSRPANETQNAVNHNSICKICFNKQAYFQISFAESIRLCTNPQCSTSEKNLKDVIQIEARPYKLDRDEQIIKYGYRLVDYNKNELDKLFQNEADLTNSVSFFSDLNKVFSNLITEPASDSRIPNALPNEATINQPNLISIDQDSLFNFPNETNDFIADSQQHTEIPVFIPNEFTEPSISSTILALTSDSQTNLQVRSESTTTQFDDNFFTTIDDLFENDLDVLSQDFTSAQPTTQFYNTPEYSYTSEPILQTTTYTELIPTSQQELSSKLANNFLYSNDFLNPTQMVSTDQTDSHSVETEKQVVISEAKTKTGSGIKITRLPKQPNKPSLCLSPTSSPSTSESNIKVSLNDATTDLSSVQLSPSSQNPEIFQSFEIPKTKKSKNENYNFLPWEVSSKTTSKRSQPAVKRESVKPVDMMKSIRPVSRAITKSDLSVKTSQQKLDFGKEKGAQLKRALLEDTNFLSQTRVFNTGGSAKDLVLSVLKKKPIA